MLGQQLDDGTHQALGSLFGPIEDRTMGKSGPKPPMDIMTNRLPDGTIAAEHEVLTLDLIANQLWHTDSTFLPVPALANILTARVLSSSGGETEFASTRAAWRELPDDLRTKAQSAVLRHGLMHSRKKLSAELAKEERFVKWGERSWKAVWHNPANGEDALYIASHAYAIDGMGDNEAKALLAELIAEATRREFTYLHRWHAGDVVMWDNRATMHRGRPWPAHEPRLMVRTTISATAADGVDTMRSPSTQAAE